MIMPHALRGNAAIFPYSLFDFANSSFVLIIHTYLFPLYFKNVLMGGSPNADAIWGTIFACSALIAAAIAPFVGALADGRNRYKVFFAIALLSFVSAVILGLSIGSTVVVISIVFIVANVCFYLASNMYDSLLTIVAAPNQRALFSGFSWGFGYTGGVVCFLIVYAFQSRFGVGSRLPYVITGLFYLVFGCIAVVLLRRHVTGSIRTRQLTFREILSKLDRPRALLLLGYALISDCVSAVTLFAAIYGSTELHLSDKVIGAWLLGIQLLAFPLTYLVSKLTVPWGIFKTLALCIGIWVIIIGVLVFSTSFILFMVVAALTAAVIGTTQSLTRAQYSLYIEPFRTSEIFGWYAIATKSAAIAAPLVFGFVSAWSGSQRLAMSLMVVPLIAGLLFVKKGYNLFARVYGESADSAVRSV